MFEKVKKAKVWIVSGAIIALCGCGGKETAVAPTTEPAGATTNAGVDFAAVTVPQSEIEWVDISTDEPADFKTPVGDGFKIKKSGLAWKVLNEGSGKGVAEIGQKVEVKYTVYHMDMKPIESNQDKNMGAYMFVLGGKSKDILPFWHEAALGMKSKAVKRLIVPPELAWGAAGQRSEINPEKFRVSPNETVIIDFEIQRFYDKSKAQIEQERIAATQPSTLPTTIPADLIIEDIKVGDGEYLKEGQRGTVKYVGKFTDGKIFDQGPAFPFRVGGPGAIEGMQIGARNMRVGGVRKLTIPPRLAYGEMGNRDIPPNATLIFEIELVKVDP